MDKIEIIEALKDMEDFAVLKKFDCPPFYLLGGSACIVEGYLDRATRDIDIVDLDYPAQIGRLFKVLGDVDYLDITLTTLADGYQSRAHRISEIQHLEIYALSLEDIIVTKIGRYSDKDKEDIEHLLEQADIKLILELIINVMERSNLSAVIKKHFIANVDSFRRDFNV